MNDKMVTGKASAITHTSLASYRGAPCLLHLTKFRLIVPVIPYPFYNFASYAQKGENPTKPYGDSCKGNATGQVASRGSWLFQRKTRLPEILSEKSRQEKTQNERKDSAPMSTLAEIFRKSSSNGNGKIQRKQNKIDVFRKEKVEVGAEDLKRLLAETGIAMISDERNREGRRRSYLLRVKGESTRYRHPWAEWVRFLEFLNAEGYMSEAFGLNEGPVNLRKACAGKNWGFVLNAALSFARENFKMSLLLDGRSLKNLAFYDYASTLNNEKIAIERLRSFFGTGGNVARTKHIYMEDVIRLLFLCSRWTEKNGSAFPDLIKWSAVKTLKDLVDFSIRSNNGHGQILLLQE